MKNMAKYTNNASPSSDLFAEYMWMGEMEKFDEEVEKEFEEQEFIRNCIEQLLDEEEERETIFFHENGIQALPNGSHNQEVPNGYGYPPEPCTNGYSHQLNGNQGLDYCMENFHIDSHLQQQVSQIVKKSTLNPNAAPFTMNPKAKEFVPRNSFMPAQPPPNQCVPTQDKTQTFQSKSS